MTAPQGPRLLDEAGGVVAAAETVTPRDTATQSLPAGDEAREAVPPQEPRLLDLPEGMEAGPVDHGWALLPPPPRRTPPSPLNWIAGGLAVLLLGWLVLSATAFVGDQFARSPPAGRDHPRGVRRRAGGGRRARAAAGAARPPRRAAARGRGAAGHPGGGGGRGAGGGQPLAGAGRGALAGLRGLALLRQVAWTAVDLLGRALADGTLAHAPVLKQLAAALPVTGVAALRLRRLADVTARACSPLG